MSSNDYEYEVLSPGGHQEMLEEVFSKVREQVGSYKTASGSLVSFADGADLPMPSFICDIDAVQDLHGYDGPWVGGAGKNKLQNTETTQEMNGITFTVNSDGSVTANGTATADAVLSIIVDTSKLYGDLYFVGCSGGSNNTYNVLMWDATANARPKKWDGTTASVNSIDGTFQEVKIVQGNTVKMQLRVMSGKTVNNVKFYPMICLSTETDPTFAPYSNICPISGHTGIDAWVRGKNLLLLTLDNVKALNTYGTWDGNVYNTQLGVTFTFTTNNEGSITSIKADGTSSSRNVTLYLQQNITNSTYPNEMTVSGCPSGGGSSTYKVRCQMQPSPNTVIVDDFGEGANFTVPNDGNSYQVIIRIQRGVTVSNLMFYPMIRPASIQDSTFEPYNPQSQTIQVSWQTEAGEVFGGYVDLVSGVLTIDKASVNLKDLTWTLNGNTQHAFDSTITDRKQGRILNDQNISNAYKMYDSGTLANYSSGFAFGNNIRIYVKDDRATTVEDIMSIFNAESTVIVYELETPITYQLTPTQIKSLKDDITNAWCSTGDIKTQYQPNNIIAELRAEILALQERVEELEQTEQTD